MSALQDGGSDGVPLVAVVVLNWNGWRDTVRCLQSLQQLAYPNYRIIVVDNGSTDDSVDQIRRVAPGAVIVQNGSNLGFAGGSNVGIRCALEDGAEYVWILNNDTTVDPLALAAMVRAAELHPRVGVVGSVIYPAEGTKIRAWGGGKVDLRTGQTRNVRGPGEEISYITGTSMFLRREALREVGGFDERFFFYWEDTDLSYRLRRAGWEVYVEANAIVRHRESAAVGRDTYLQARYFHRGLVMFLRKYAARPMVPAARALYRRMRVAIGRRQWNVQRGILRGWVEGWLAR
jgi:GT2 family glycosyltransferase